MIGSLIAGAAAGLAISGAVLFNLFLFSALGALRRENAELQRKNEILSDVVDKQVYNIQKTAAARPLIVGITDQQIFNLAGRILEDIQILQEPKN